MSLGSATDADRICASGRRHVNDNVEGGVDVQVHVNVNGTRAHWL
jgi:hypothetical protein